ncbi:MAG: hypothetical protein ACR2N6_07475 [Miltoncostaeaceae bacterium]
MSYVAIALLVGVMSATPLPWPPSWVVLAVIALEFDVAPVGVVLAGALGAATARAGLAWTVGRFGPAVLGSRRRGNVEYLAGRLAGRRGRAGMAGLLALSPPPSWVVNASAGLLAVPIAIVFGANLLGRTVVFGIGVGATNVAAADLTDRLREAFGPLPVAVTLLVVVVVVWAVLTLDWRAAIEDRRLRLATAGRGADVPPDGEGG